MNISSGFVVVLGLVTVFLGLIAIILLCKLMSFFVGLTTKNGTVNEEKTSSQPQAQNIQQPIPDKSQLLAAISAVVAEELGTDISNIRIHSIKKA